MCEICSKLTIKTSEQHQDDNDIVKNIYSKQQTNPPSRRSPPSHANQLTGFYMRADFFTFTKEILNRKIQFFVK